MRRVLRWPEFVPLFLLILAFIAGKIESPYFLDLNYLLDRTTSFAEMGLMVIGMTFVIIAGEIDLSVASNLALVACVAAKFAAAGNLGLGIAVGLLLGCLAGAFNGALVAYAKLPSLLVTLATFAFFRGIAQAFVGSESVALPASFVGVNQLYLPYPVPITLVFLLLVAAFLGLVLHRSILGRWIYATGSNEEAARFLAVPTARVKFWAFVLSGGLSAIGAILMNSRLGVARFDDAQGYELDVITAAVLGGASIYGGKGSMLGAVLAFFLIFFVRTGLSVANVPAEYQLAVVGTLLIFAVGLSALLARPARARA